MDKKVEILSHSDTLIPHEKDLLHDEVVRFKRDLPPAHYSFKVESFSKMSKIFPGDKEPKYDSEVFECGGYKWRLSFYPNGRKDCSGEGNISLYLVISETDSLPLGWEVNAVFRLFVLDQIRGEYLTLQDAEVRLFHAMKTEWGFARFLSLSTFGDILNGYIVDDSCVFGAEVFVIKGTGKGECLSILSSPITSSCTWEIERFSALSGDVLRKELRLGDRKWELKLYPKYVSPDDGKSYVAFVFSVIDWEVASPPKGKLYAKYTLRVKDRRPPGLHEEITEYNWFSPSSKGYFHAKFMPLVVLRDPAKGFLLSDTLVVEINIEILSFVKNFTEKK